MARVAFHQIGNERDRVPTDIKTAVCDCLERRPAQSGRLNLSSINLKLLIIVIVLNFQFALSAFQRATIFFSIDIRDASRKSLYSSSYRSVFGRKQFPFETVDFRGVYSP